MNRSGSHIALFLAVLACVLVGGTVSVLAQPTGPAQPVNISADSTHRHLEGGEEVAELWGHVWIMQGATTITADNAVYYGATQHAVLNGNVRVTQPGLLLTAPHAEYDGGTKVATASGGVTIRDSGATIEATNARYDIGRRIAYFDNGVTLHDDSAVLRANSGEYRSLELKAIFRGNVRVDSDSGTIRSRELTYWRNTGDAYAVGNVVLTSEKYATRLFGDTLVNAPNRDYTLVLGSPKLVRIDTVAATDSLAARSRDTTVIVARKMEAFRGVAEEYVATDDVKLNRGNLRAVGRIVRFLPKENVICIGPGRAAPAVDSSGASIGVDTAASTAKVGVTGETRRIAGGGDTASASKRGDVTNGNPIVWYNDSQLTGDTITVLMQEQALRAIDVLGNSFAVSRGRFDERYDQLAGTRLFFDILLDTIRQVRSEGYASSIYFLYNQESPDGVFRASGDTILVDFADGRAAFIAILRGRRFVEGDAVPEREVAGRERSYRLDGFHWYPVELAEVSVTESASEPPADRGGSTPNVDSRKRP